MKIGHMLFGAGVVGGAAWIGLWIAVVKVISMI